MVELPNLGYSRHMKELKEQSFIVPSSIQEQTKIAEFLGAIDEKISQAQSQLELVKQYKQGLLQQMFV
jgi:type I restriction enzyme S subunit